MLIEKRQRRPGRRRPLAALCLASALVLCLGWTVLWVLARHEAAEAMEGWIADEAGHGRQWTCGNRQITGFPFKLRVTCAHPAFHGAIGGEVIDVSAAALTAVAYLHQPNAVEARVSTPVTLTTAGDERPSVLDASVLTIEARLLADRSARVEVQLEDPSLDGPGLAGKAAHAELHVTPDLGTTARDKAYRVSITLDGGALPGVDAALRNADPLSFKLDGTLTHTVPASGEPWQVLVERWRQAGGLCDLSVVDVAKGEMKAALTGTLGLDDAHRISGRLGVKLSGALLTSVLRSAADRNLLHAGVSMVLTGALAQSAGGSMISLPVSLSDGRVAVGPLPMPQRLAPLY